MVPRKPLALWQNSAQHAAARAMSFALVAVLDEPDHQAKGHQPDAAVYQDCYPSLPLRPGLARVGSLFKGPLSPAKFRRSCTFRFSARLVAIKSSAITTLKRGSQTCTNPLSRLLFLPSLPLATARSIPTVRPLGLLAGPHWAPRPITIWPKAPSPVAFWALLRAIRACAADLATGSPLGRTMTRATKARALVAFSYAVT